MSTPTFVLAKPNSARNRAEFSAALGKIIIQSIYFHVFDAALPLEQGENDFPRWFRALE